MVRTLEGKEIHQELMKRAAEWLKSQGYEVVFQAKINDLRIDVLGIKDKEKVGVECMTWPNWKALKERLEKCKGKLSRLIVAIPSYVTTKQTVEGIEIMKIELPKNFIRITVRIPQDLYEKLTLLAIEERKTKEKVALEAIKDLVEKYKNLAR